MSKKVIIISIISIILNHHTVYCIITPIKMQDIEKINYIVENCEDTLLPCIFAV